MQRTAEVTAAYRQAKKAQADGAAHLGSLRSEVRQLTRRIEDGKDQGRDISMLESCVARVQEQLRQGEIRFNETANAYRVSHLELLMQDSTLSHYAVSTSQQKRLADLSDDETERAIAEDMQATLELAHGLAKALAATSLEGSARERGELADLFAAAETGGGFGAYRDDAGIIHEVHCGDDGQLASPTAGVLGQIPFTYERGMRYREGRLALNSSVRLERMVTPCIHTGYSRAYSVPGHPVA